MMESNLINYYFTTKIIVMDNEDDKKLILTKSVVRHIILYGNIIKHWSSSNPYILLSLDQQMLYQGFPHTINLFIEKGLLARLFSLGKEKVGIDDLHHIFVTILYENMAYIWKEDFKLANFDTSGYIDNLIRSRLVTEAGVGIGFFCLQIAKYVTMTPVIQEEIETSKIVVPLLPFSSTEYQALQLSIG